MGKNIVSRSASVVLALCLMLTALAAPMGAAVGDTVTSNWRLPFQGSYFVDNGASSEFVDLSGSVHLVVKYYPGDPTVPPNPIRIHTNLVSVSGVGRTSGQSYRLTGAANFELDADAGSTFAFVGSYRLIPTDPCKGCPTSARFLPIRYAVMLNSAGEVTEATATAGGGGVDSE